MLSVRSLPFLRCAALAALIFPATQTAFARQQRRQPQPQHQPQLVESINVVGNRRLTDTEILKHVKTRAGDPYDPGQVQHDLQTLINLGIFDRRLARVFIGTGQRGGVEVFFVMRELTVIEAVKFEGLRRADERALLEELRRRSLEVSGGSVYDPDKIREAMDAMKELLLRRGWLRAGVEARMEEVTTTSVKLTFVVNGVPPTSPRPKKSDKPGRRDAIA